MKFKTAQFQAASLTEELFSLLSFEGLSSHSRTLTALCAEWFCEFFRLVGLHDIILTLEQRGLQKLHPSLILFI